MLRMSTGGWLREPQNYPEQTMCGEEREETWSCRNLRSWSALDQNWNCANVRVQPSAPKLLCYKSGSEQFTEYGDSDDGENDHYSFYLNHHPQISERIISVSWRGPRVGSSRTWLETPKCCGDLVGILRSACQQIILGALLCRCCCSCGSCCCCHSIDSSLTVI